MGAEKGGIIGLAAIVIYSLISKKWVANITGHWVNIAYGGDSISFPNKLPVDASQGQSTGLMLYLSNVKVPAGNVVVIANMYNKDGLWRRVTSGLLYDVGNGSIVRELSKDEVKQIDANVRAGIENNWDSIIPIQIT